MSEMTTPKPVPPVLNPSVDLAQHLHYLIGETGSINESMGGYRIKVFHTRAFPWDDVFKTLLYRDFRVYVTRHKADIYIEATP
jgi:hypothetical protein